MTDCTSTEQCLVLRHHYLSSYGLDGRTSEQVAQELFLNIIKISDPVFCWQAICLYQICKSYSPDHNMAKPAT